MTMTAREVVAEYLAKKSAKTAPQAEREAAHDAARAIIDEMPDGFTARDVRACVSALSEGDETLTAMTPARRNRAVTKTLDAMVADGALKLEGDDYAHAYNPAAAS